MFSIISRAKWGAKYREGFGARKLPAKTAHVHHSVTKAPGKDATLRQDIAAVRTLERIGQARFGRGISYSRVIMPSGRVFSGLRPSRIGSHTRGHNTTGLGYVFVGNYQSKAPGDKQLDALAWAIARDMKKGYLAKGAKILGHRDTSATACPGNAAYKLLGRVRKDVAASLVATSRPAKRMPLVRLGSSGGAVKTLQKALNAKGARLVADGRFGPTTKAAVVAFQKKAGLTADGVVGAKTWSALGY